ncbi:heme NO-binding domain-containing protein [Pseudoalteromonas atlantica]|uniref:heme NO-binding domain-containing protein n=1 Tax=Pseudoalteromonas atlantica TaxID=288 RepID=UPI003735150D
MKGSIFRALETMVLQHRDASYWDSLLNKHTPTGRCYVVVNDYPDAELYAMVTDICEELQLTLDEVLALFGRHLFAHLMHHYEVVVSRFAHFEALILNINNVIHKEVNKLDHGANLPTMRCMMIRSGHIEIHYNSPRKLCILAEGLIYGAGEHFDMAVKITHPQCQHRGAESCILNVYYTRLEDDG